MAGMGAAALGGWSGAALAEAAAVGGSIPAARAIAGGGPRRWAPDTRTRIVADDAARGEAVRLSRALAALGFVPRPPRIVARGGEHHDLVLGTTATGSAEGYGMRLGSTGPLRLTAQGPAGLFYAGRTLLHWLVTAGAVPELAVDDAPALPERGVSVDVGRKYFTLAWLQALIRQMAWWKLNTLHLHLTDNEGFGYASRRHPAFASPERLSLDNLRTLVAYAAAHHIAVVPEMDSPGHLGAVLRHAPELMLRAADGSATGKAMDIANPAARALAADLIDELLPVFPGDRWHLGGDEVLLTEKPGASSADLDRLFPQLVAYAARRGGAGATAHDATTLYLNDLNARLRARGKRCRGWNDGLQGQGVVRVDPDIDVDYWENLGGTLKTAERHLADGHRLLNAHSRYLYYVVAEPPFPWYPRPTAQRIYTEWDVTRFEGQPPLPATSPALIGGHFAIWADRPQARTQEQIAADIAAPLAAFAQKAWGGATVPIAFDAFARRYAMLAKFA